MTPRRFPVGLTIATVISLAILCGLGAWQLKRLAWKTDLLASIASAQAQPPRPVNEVPLTPAYRFRRVTLDCPGLASARSSSSTPSTPTARPATAWCPCAARSAPGRRSWSIAVLSPTQSRPARR